MHLLETRERLSRVSLKVRAFLLFQMFQAMAVLMVVSSKVLHRSSQKSEKLETVPGAKTLWKKAQTSAALGQ
jgi:predicted membrane channel-forming protein YqfA (hemolysin III family)